MGFRWLGALALFLLAVLLFLGLGSVGLLSVDEPRYASIGREMAAGGDWITPHLWGSPWFEKPPLLFWLVAIANKVGLRDETAARLPVALFSFAFLIFFYRTLRDELGDEAAVPATGILATSAGWFALSRVAVTDMPMAACLASAMLLAMRERNLWAAGVLLGFAVLAKAGLAVVLALPVLWWYRRRLPDLVMPTVVMLVVALPWFLLCWMRNGKPFWDELIVRHHFARFSSAETGMLHPYPWWFYVPVVAAGLCPWAAGLIALFRRDGWEDRRVQRLAGWFGFGFLFLSLSSGKLPAYALALLPPLAALIGMRMRGAAWGWIQAVSAGMFVLIVPVVVEILPDAIDRGILQVSWRGSWSPWGAVLALAAVAVSRLHAWVPYVVVALTMIGAQGPLADRLEKSVSARPLWREVQSRNLCLDPGLRRQWVYGLQYYAGRELPVCEEQDTRFRVSK